MTSEEQRPEGEEVPRETGSEETTSGPQSHEEPVAEGGADAAAESAADSTDADAEAVVAAAEELLEEAENPYLEDLRRLTAEYANYRKRTEENTELEKLRAAASVMLPLLGVLDDLDRAEAHGDLVEGSAFATIALKLRTTLEKQGLESFGEKGEAFDPQHHEAITQVPVPGTEEHTVLDVVEVGYRLGDVELRPAKVAVAVSADG